MPDPSNTASSPHDQLWFPDGTIILQCRPFLFKVYGGLLSQRSEVFREIIDFADGCEWTIHDSGVTQYDLDDDGKDMGLLLQCLFDSTTYHTTLSNYRSSERLLPIACKYGLTTMWEQINAIHPLYPMDYAGFLKYRADLAKSPPRIPSPSPPSTSDIMVANALRKHAKDLRSLPFILYRMSHDLVTASEPSALSPENRCAVLAGRAAMTTFALMTSLACLFDMDDTNGCQSVPDCTQAKLALARQYQPSRETGVLDPLVEWSFEVYKGGAGKVKALCSWCKERCVKANEEARKEAWDKLPGMFGLPPWEELNRSVSP